MVCDVWNERYYRHFMALSINAGLIDSSTISIFSAKKFCILKTALITFFVGLYFVSFYFKTTSDVKMTIEATTLHLGLLLRWLKSPK